jgi:hypothetical protein
MSRLKFEVGRRPNEQRVAIATAAQAPFPAITALPPSVQPNNAPSIRAGGRGAACFYEAHGFIRLVDSMRLILPMQTAASLIEHEPGRR